MNAPLEKINKRIYIHAQLAEFEELSFYDV